jgi:hypothetical protein
MVLHRFTAHDQFKDAVPGDAYKITHGDHHGHAALFIAVGDDTSVGVYIRRKFGHHLINHPKVEAEYFPACAISFQALTAAPQLYYGKQVGDYVVHTPDWPRGTNSWGVQQPPVTVWSPIGYTTEIPDTASADVSLWGDISPDAYRNAIIEVNYPPTPTNDVQDDSS